MVFEENFSSKDITENKWYYNRKSTNPYDNNSCIRVMIS
jgi:hypothetical protein